MLRFPVSDFGDRQTRLRGSTQVARPQLALASTSLSTPNLAPSDQLIEDPDVHAATTAQVRTDGRSPFLRPRAKARRPTARSPT